MVGRHMRLSTGDGAGLFPREWGITSFLPFFGPSCPVMATGRCVT